MTKKPRRRVVHVEVPSRSHVDPDVIERGTDAWRTLEQAIADAYAFAGIDASAPMRRDIVMVLRGEAARENAD